MWPLDLLLSLAVPALALLGGPTVRAWRGRVGVELDPSTAFAAALALGLGFAQAGGMLLGFTGGLRARPVALWLALGLAAALALWVRQGRPRPRLSPPSLAALATAALFLPYLLVATVPPWYRDEMMYHLALPRAFAVAGGYVQPDDNIFNAFPLGFESIQALLHALGAGPDRFAPFNPRLVGAWTALGTALACVGLARAAGVPAHLARWAPPLLLLVPTFFEFGPSAYVEPYLMLWSTLALTAVLRILAGERAFLLPAALCAGAAASVKYPGLAVAAFLAVLLLADLLRREPADQVRAARALLVFCAVSGLVAAPFYVRNLLERGNPVFPVAFGLFGGRGWDSWRALAYGITLDNYGLGRSPLDLLLLPFRLFTATDLRHGFEGALTPLLGLGLLAGGGFAAANLRAEAPSLPRRPLAATLLFALLWSLFWASTVQQVRFYLVAVPALLALLLAALAALERLRPRAARLALGLTLLGSLAWTASRAAELWNRQLTSDWLLGRVARDALLSRMLPESYAFNDELERLVPPDGKVWLVWMRTHTYYLRRAFREDMVFEAWRLEALLDLHADPAAARAALRADGITHLLVHHGFFLVEGNADFTVGTTERTERLQRRFEDLLAGGALRPQRSWGPITLYAVSAP